MSLGSGNLLLASAGDTGYNLTRSLRFRASASAYLNRTPAGAGTGGGKTWTLSTWLKRGSLGSAQEIFSSGVASNTAGAVFFEFGSNDTLNLYVITFGLTQYQINTTQVFRDPSAWYHIVAVVDTTQATASNRLKLYVNGAQITSFSTANYPALNDLFTANNGAYPQNICRLNYDGTRFFDGYLAEFNMVDGQALTPSSFGSTNALTGVWQPARYTGTYGTNGFYLPFTDNSALTTSSNVGLGKDFSGNGNYWTTNNISITAGVTYDSMTDVPTLTSATASNYPTFNPLIPSSYQTLSNGSLTSKCNTSTDSGASYSTMATGSTGKWYMEFTADTSTGAGYPIIGTILDSANLGNANSTAGIPGTGGGGACGFRSNGNKYISGTSSSYGNTYATNDIIGISIDCDNGAVYFSINGTWQNSGSPTSGATKTGAANTWTGGSASFYIGVAGYTSGNGAQANFGQRPFTYTPPTGYVALNTYNLPTSTILKGNKVMDATLYTGTGANQNIVNAGGFKPDFVWGKLRNGADQNFLVNSVAGATNYLVSNSINPEVADATTVVSLNSNGFTVGTSTNLNRSGGYNFVAWQWQAGQGSTSSNTSGSITSTVSVNASAGFSVVTWTGTGANATVGHGLGVAPQLIINKPRNAADNWISWHTSLGATGYIYLNLTNASATAATVWNSTLPTSSVFSVGTSSNVNTSGQTMVSYCWTPIAGYSAFGSYTGNGSTDGPFVYTGFRPKWIMVKNTGQANDWFVMDSSMNTYNVVGEYLLPNSSAASNTNGWIDFLSNGFKVRSGATGNNNSGIVQIYAAFAENPFRNSLAR